MLFVVVHVLVWSEAWLVPPVTVVLLAFSVLVLVVDLTVLWRKIFASRGHSPVYLGHAWSCVPVCLE